MTERIKQTFARCAEENRAALITYFMAGDSSLACSFDVGSACIESGADIIELGMPFSDPMADGPVIQVAANRSLAAGTVLADVLEQCKKLRLKFSKTPIILMGYYNPVFQYGVEKFAQDAAKSGADGIIIVDVPYEEEGELLPALEKNGLCHIKLITPTTGVQRMRQVLKTASGFIYYVSIAGVTGAKSAEVKTIEERVKQIKAASSLPVAVGFGIKTPDQAAEIAKITDGVVVGSSIVHFVESMESDREQACDQIAKLVRSIAQATYRDK